MRIPRRVAAEQDNFGGKRAQAANEPPGRKRLMLNRVALAERSIANHIELQGTPSKHREGCGHGSGTRKPTSPARLWVGNLIPGTLIFNGLH